MIQVDSGIFMCSEIDTCRGNELFEYLIGSICETSELKGFLGGMLILSFLTFRYYFSHASYEHITDFANSV